MSSLTLRKIHSASGGVPVDFDVVPTVNGAPLALGSSTSSMDLPLSFSTSGVLTVGTKTVQLPSASLQAPGLMSIADKQKLASVLTTSDASGILSGTFSPARLPLASRYGVGAVRIGDGLTVDAQGVISVSSVTTSSGSVPDATTSARGVIRLAGDLAGTANSPTVPGLASKANLTYVNSQLALKQRTITELSDVPAIQTAINGKADQSHFQPASSITGLSNSAIVDTTNASNISSGTLSANRLPPATTSALGGIKAGSGLLIAADGTLSVSTAVTGTGAVVGNATTAALGLVQLSGDLGGTATSPTVPGLAFKQNTLNSYADVPGLSTVLAGKSPISHSHSAAAISGLAASATTDTTNANNITAGVLAAARLPVASSLTIGAVKAGTGIAIAGDGTISVTGTSTGSGSALAANKAWSSSWSMSGYDDYGAYSVSGPLSLTADTVGAVNGGRSQAIIIANGVNVPLADNKPLYPYVNVAGTLHVLTLMMVGGNKLWSCSPPMDTFEYRPSPLDFTVSTNGTFSLASKPVRMSWFAAGALSSSQVLAMFSPNENMSIPSNFAGSRLSSLTAPSALTTFTFIRTTAAGTTSAVGTAVFSVGSKVASLTMSTSLSLSIGDTLTLTAPATVDATLASVQFTLAASLT